MISSGTRQDLGRVVDGDAQPFPDLCRVVEVVKPGRVHLNGVVDRVEIPVQLLSFKQIFQIQCSLSLYEVQSKYCCPPTNCTHFHKQILAQCSSYFGYVGIVCSDWFKIVTNERTHLSIEATVLAFGLVFEWNCGLDVRHLDAHHSDVEISGPVVDKLLRDEPIVQAS